MLENFDVLLLGCMSLYSMTAKVDLPAQTGYRGSMAGCSQAHG